MDKSKYNQMIHAQETQRLNAWAWVRENWASPVWIPIPKDVKMILGFHSSVGVCSCNLVTKKSSDGFAEFVDRMNRKRA